LSISSEITRLSGNISAALTAIEAKGVTIPSGANSDDLATLIAAIETGGGGPTYSLETIVPETTVTPTGEATLLYRGASFESGGFYLTTVNGTQRVNTAVIADGNLSLSDQDYANPVTSPSPWFDVSNGNIYLYTRRYNVTYTIKIEKLTLNSN
jgi:hypothetical protein